MEGILYREKDCYFEDVVSIMTMIHLPARIERMRSRAFFENITDDMTDDTFSIKIQTLLRFGVIGHVSFQIKASQKKVSFENKWTNCMLGS